MRACITNSSVTTILIAHSDQINIKKETAFGEVWSPETPTRLALVNKLSSRNKPVSGVGV